MINILIDTNVLIYAFDKTSQFHEQSAKQFRSEENNLFTTTKNISEFFAVCSKLNLDFAKTFGFYTDVKENFTILKPDALSLLKFEFLLKKYQPKGNRVYDIEIVSIMLANELKNIVTANITDFKNVTEVELIDIK
nr:PIN domain-containing protein [Bacteroidota bacterium]